MTKLVDHLNRWFGTKDNPVNVAVVGGTATEGTAGEVEVTNWPDTINTKERNYRIYKYGYVEIPDGGAEVEVETEGKIFSFRNFDMSTVVFLALEPGKTDAGIPILPRSASRGYVNDGPVYLYANSDQPVRVYYQYLEMGG